MAERAVKPERDAAVAEGKAPFRGRRRSRLHAPLAAVREGLRYKYFASLSETFALPARELSAALGIPERTLARRKAEGNFSPEESDRLARLQRIAEFTEKVLGDRAKASEWLQRRNHALGGEPPLSWLDTDLGSRQVEDILGRIAHGVTG